MTIVLLMFEFLSLSETKMFIIDDNRVINYIWYNFKYDVLY